MTLYSFCKPNEKKKRKYEEMTAPRYNGGDRMESIARNIWKGPEKT